MANSTPASGPGHANAVVRVVVPGEIIHPTVDEVKKRRGFVDAEWRPKRAKVSLLPTDNVRVVQFELYRQNHRCDICDQDSKSPRVLLLENIRTGTRFYAAGVPLRAKHRGLLPCGPGVVQRA